MSAFIRSVVSPLLKVWLRSQVDSLKHLEVKIDGADGQILKGKIPQATVSGQGIVYQGLHLSSICLRAEGIYLNIPQIVKREPLKLLAPIQVYLDVTLEATDLKLCLDAPMIREALGNTKVDLDSDDKAIASLKAILRSLGGEFKLEALSVNQGKCCCQGMFEIKAT
jgi:hypothetical protein